MKQGKPEHLSGFFFDKSLAKQCYPPLFLSLPLVNLTSKAINLFINSTAKIYNLPKNGKSHYSQT